MTQYPSYLDASPDEAAALLHLQDELQQRGDQIVEIAGHPWAEAAPALEMLAHGGQGE